MFQNVTTVVDDEEQEVTYEGLRIPSPEYLLRNGKPMKGKEVRVQGSVRLEL